MSSLPCRCHHDLSLAGTCLPDGGAAVDVCANPQAGYRTALDCRAQLQKFTGVLVASIHDPDGGSGRALPGFSDSSVALLPKKPDAVISAAWLFVRGRRYIC